MVTGNGVVSYPLAPWSSCVSGHHHVHQLVLHIQQQQQQWSQGRKFSCCIHPETTQSTSSSTSAGLRQHYRPQRKCMSLDVIIRNAGFSGLWSDREARIPWPSSKTLNQVLVIKAQSKSSDDANCCRNSKNKTALMKKKKKTINVGVAWWNGVTVTTPWKWYTIDFPILKRTCISIKKNPTLPPSLSFFSLSLSAERKPSLEAWTIILLIQISNTAYWKWTF